MAGITLLYRQEKLESSLLQKIEGKLGKSEDVSILHREDKFVLLQKKIEDYPVREVNHQDYTLIVEGKIYGVDVLNDGDFSRCTHGVLFNKNKEDSLRYIRSLDGEFILYMIDKSTKKVVIINDYLGRLPVYYIRNDHFTIGRDIGLIHKTSGSLKFSESGVYQYMRLGYPLGDTTLFKDMYRLPPSSLIEIEGEVNIQSQKISLKELHDSGGISGNPEEYLYEHFKRAMDVRLKSSERVVLSLSGGLDSRIIMGEIEKGNGKVAYESFHYTNAIIDADIRSVQQLCNHYERQFGLTELEEWSPENFNELIHIKTGMNYLGMAFLVPFLKKMKSGFDLMLTGDGGDKTLPYLLPGMNLFGSDTAQLILSRNEVTSDKTCEQLFSSALIKQEEEMIAYLNEQNEKEPGWTYKRFLIFERTKNWLFEGEDRNRNYIWSSSPFYNPGFFKAVHSINERDKKNYRLYRSFTALVDPDLNNITNANWGFPVSKQGKLNYLLAKQAIKQNVNGLFSFKKASLTIFSGLPDLVNTLLAKGAGVPLNLNKNPDLNALSNESLLHLLTLLKVAELLDIKD